MGIFSKSSSDDYFKDDAGVKFIPPSIHEESPLFDFDRADIKLTAEDGDIILSMGKVYKQICEQQGSQAEQLGQKLIAKQWKHAVQGVDVLLDSIKSQLKGKDTRRST